MAKFVFTDAYVSINGTVLSDHVKSVTLNTGAEAQDDTVMGDDTRSNIGGLKTWSVEVEFAQDFAASQVDATLSTMGVGGTGTIAVRPTSAAKSATNPEYTGTGMLESYGPMDGNIGDLATARASFSSAGTLTRSTV